MFTEIIDSSLLSSHLADLLKAVFLGFIEGLTEFLPVSSTAHLIISSHLINFSAIANNIFEITIQIGAILAIILLYRKRILDVLLHLHHKKQQKFALNVILAFLPAAFIGLAFHSIIKQFLFSNFVIALALILGGVIMIIIDKNPKVSQQAKVKNLDDVSNITALKIGFFQCLAMIPGVSRSGATIIGGMLLKLDRKTAAEFSFFLAIPTIISAALYDLLKNYSALKFDDLNLIFVGFLSAFFSALLLIKWFIGYVSKNNFVIFGLYRVFVGLLILFWLL